MWGTSFSICPIVGGGSDTNHRVVIHLEHETREQARLHSRSAALASDSRKSPALFGKRPKAGPDLGDQFDKRTILGLYIDIPEGGRRPERNHQICEFPPIPSV